MDTSTASLSSQERLATIERLNLTSAVIRPIFDRLTRLTARVLRAPICLITLVDAERHYIVSSVGLPEPYVSEGLLPLGYSLCHQIASTARPLILEDVRLDLSFASLPAVTALNMIAYAGFPLILRSGIALGALAVVDRQPRAWTAEERANLEDLAHSVITEIELRDELLQHKAADIAMRHSIEQMRILRRIENELAETLNLDSVLNVAMDAALRASRADNAIIGLIKEDELEIAAAAGTWAFSPGVRLPRDIGVIGRVLKSGVGELITDVDADPNYIRYIPSTRAQMVIPLAYRDRQIGVLNLETSRPERFTPESFEFLSLVAGRIAISIDNAQLYNLLNDQFNSLQALYARVRDLELTKT
ncbi:MAG: GAF domain-containing protein, partial [Anaerolinea sp.]|nr:GAF domain-containing protein [Anaerolinea sp.]